MQTQRTRSRDSLLQELTRIASDIIGTKVPIDSPLMSVGLDSIAATDFSTQISKLLDQELAQTLVFDHPTLQSIADALLINDGEP